MIAINVLVVLLIAHWISDFILQNDWMAKGKSKSNIPLLTHGAVYTVSLGVISLSILGYYFNYSHIDLIWFALISGVLHTATDYVTSRISSYLYGIGKIGGNIPNFGFFTIVGLDQLLHYIMLFYVWVAIFN